ncbi:MAG: response regulator [Salinivirgaceae bacterium]|jgi:signal transduction histidine kinase/ligand-binding sensor domain-containing protein/DNA-binding response OmpR family regulator|nr:response regulator [Salinivirgaceae bacterium]
MHLRYFLIITFQMLFSAYLSKAQQINFAHIDYTHGLSNNRILSFAEDDNGFVWIGTTSGLNRYDGYNIKTFKHDPSDSSSLIDNMVQSIVKDQLGRLWVGTTRGFVIFNPDTETFTIDFHFSIAQQPFSLFNISEVLPFGDSLLLMRIQGLGIIVHNLFTNNNRLLNCSELTTGTNKVGIISRMKTSNNKLYLMSDNGLIYIVDVIDRKVLKIIKAVNSMFNGQQHLYDFYVDHNQDIWVYSSNEEMGLLLIDDKENIRHFNTKTEPRLNSKIVSRIIQDSENNYWIGTDHGGLNILSSDKQKMTYIKHEEANNNSLSQNVITELFKSNKGIIWVGTFKKGVNYYHKSLFRFFHFMHRPDDKNSLSYNDVNCFAEDKKGNLWIGTNGNGLIYFDREKNTFSNIFAEPNNPEGLKSNVIVSLYMDKSDVLWVGTYHGGLARFQGGKFKTYLHKHDNPESISDNRIWDIYEDSKGNFWIGTLGGGLNLFDKDQEVFYHYSGMGINSLNSNFVIDINEDAQGNVWFGTDNGVFVLDAESSRFIQFTNIVDNTKSLSGNFASKVFVDSKQNLWFGTRDGLNLFDVENKSFIRFNSQNGLPDNSIMGIRESDEGDLWLSTSGGICKLTVEFDSNGKYVNHQAVNFNEADGLQGREFNEGSTFKTSKGELIFGGANGFNLFLPQTKYEKIEPLKTYIVGLELFGEELTKNHTDAKKMGLNSSLLNNSEINLAYNENIFSLKFVSINYLVSRKIKYRYKLEGFNEQWIYTNWKERKATFTNLNAGTYKFIVQASYSNSDWNSSESSLRIVIHPPWYSTWLAYVIYFTAIVFAIILARRNVIAKERNKYLKEEAIKESERQQELNVLKTRFFTNVSHEFRTPLTLILTPLEKLLKTNIEVGTRKHLELMNQNAKRLLLLVNQLLDFRKAEANKLHLNLIYGNIISFIDSTVLSFADFRESKNISLEFLPEENELFMLFDKDKIEKIILNLLSNAFKFTPEGGSIKVFAETLLKKEKEFLKIKVEDTGIGISSVDQHKIFERFYQTELPNEFITKGSGIGLSLTNDFVKLHGGNISVKSTEGQGSKFIVKLPIDRTRNIERLDDKKNSDLSLKDEYGNEPEKKELNKKIILLVEDNADFRFYLKDSLMEKYKILEAANGKLGLNIIASDQPHLIVSDVMMPEMDGFEFCDTIKSNADYSHIPVILLTAKSTQQDKLEGLKHGADDYITKPFNFDILEARIDYLLGLRQKFIKDYQKSFEVKVDDKSIMPLDKVLLDKAIALINENLSNSEFSVEGMSKDLGMSRVHLYKKLTALTGKTPIELIRLVRIKKAAGLLMKGELNVSEITYEVGFSDPKYFSKMFKLEFGVLPSKYMG